MKQLLQAAVVTGALALGSQAVMAQSVPSNPTNPILNADTGNSNLIFWAFDPIRGVSLTTNLGLRLDEILPSTSNMETDGFSLDFGTLAGYVATFGASTVSNIVWGVAAADGAAPGLRIAATGPLGALGFDPGFMNVGGVTSATNNFIAFVSSVNTACPGPSNTCVVTDSLANGYAGAENWGVAFGNNLGWTAVANPGTALGFYYVTTPAGRPTAGTAAPRDQYASAAGVGQWLLSQSGALSYSVPAIPLPAAAWLLLSGLAGFGVLSRRRAAAAA